MQIKVQTPAKINLILEILRKRADGFHEIRSIMQTVSLYDFLTIKVENTNLQQNLIELSGNSKNIPYDKSNLAYKAAELFMNKANLSGFKIKIYIEKNIPVAAGLAGGSSNAAGILTGLNSLFNNILSENDINMLASQLGSDVNFCLEGGTQIATSRGEILNKISTPNLNIAVIKPKNIFISAKEAYTKYSKFLSDKTTNANTIQMENAIINNNSDKIAKLLKNNLEDAILPDYPEIQEIKDYLIKKGCKNTIMSGSGPSVFGICEEKIDFSDAKPQWECFNTKTINFGIKSETD